MFKNRLPEGPSKKEGGNYEFCGYFMEKLCVQSSNILKEPAVAQKREKLVCGALGRCFCLCFCLTDDLFSECLQVKYMFHEIPAGSLNLGYFVTKIFSEFIAQKIKVEMIEGDFCVFQHVRLSFKGEQQLAQKEQCSHEKLADFERKIFSEFIGKIIKVEMIEGDFCMLQHVRLSFKGEQQLAPQEQCSHIKLTDFERKIFSDFGKKIKVETIEGDFCLFQHVRLSFKGEPQLAQQEQCSHEKLVDFEREIFSEVIGKEIKVEMIEGDFCLFQHVRLSFKGEQQLAQQEQCSHEKLADFERKIFDFERKFFRVMFGLLMEIKIEYWRLVERFPGEKKKNTTTQPTLGGEGVGNMEKRNVKKGEEQAWPWIIINRDMVHIIWCIIWYVRVTKKRFKTAWVVSCALGCLWGCRQVGQRLTSSLGVDGFLLWCWRSKHHKHQELLTSQGTQRKGKRGRYQKRKCELRNYKRKKAQLKGCVRSMVQGWGPFVLCVISDVMFSTVIKGSMCCTGALGMALRWPGLAKVWRGVSIKKVKQNTRTIISIGMIILACISQQILFMVTLSKVKEVWIRDFLILWRLGWIGGLWVLWGIEQPVDWIQVCMRGGQYMKQWIGVVGQVCLYQAERMKIEEIKSTTTWIRSRQRLWYQCIGYRVMNGKGQYMHLHAGWHECKRRNRRLYVGGGAKVTGARQWARRMK